MGLIIQKFGGTSVADTTRIKNIVSLVQEELDQNNSVVVVVSAMAGVTNHLITLCNEVSTLENNSKMQEYDLALSSGEIVTAALLALSLQQKNISAKSFTGWQLPIRTNKNPSQASVLGFEVDGLEKALKDSTVPIIAGFQGLNSDNRVTTLGRGGSDITAVLTAAALRADRCDIYTDVEGIYTADPRIVHNAKRLSQVSYEQMLEFAASGAKVLHPRCVELAQRYNIHMRVLSSFSKNSGTSITSKHEIMENKHITGIASDKNLLKILIDGARFNLCELCLIITDRGIGLNFVQTGKSCGSFNFLASLNDKIKLEILLKELVCKQKIKSFNLNGNVATVTIVGYGIKTDNTVIQTIVRKLEKAIIPVEMIEIAEIKISILINDQYTEKAINALHELIE